MNINEVEISKDINYKVLNGLKILMYGKSLTYQGYEVKLSEAINDSFAPIMIVNEDGHVQGADMKFSQFFKWLNEYNEDDITIKLAEISLTEINRRKREIK